MPTKQFQLYKCPVCATVVEVIDECGLDLVCCGPPMVSLAEKTSQSGQDRHQPVLERTGRRVRVRVGQTPHPMTEDHQIRWIEMVSEGRVCRHFLAPGQAPEAVFECDSPAAVARAYCNRHGLWSSAEPKDEAAAQVPAAAGAEMEI